MMMLQHAWQGLCEGLWTAAFLLLNPFSAVLFLSAVVVISICLRGSKDRFAKVAILLAIVLGGYAAFNIADYCVYRYCGAIAVSPMNQIFFQLFCSPEDLYEPYASIVLSPDKTEYEVEFMHKYAGREEIAFCLSDGEKWIEKYDDCADFIVRAKGALTSEDGERMEIDDSADVKVFAPGKIAITIHPYCLDSRHDCRKKYKLKIKFSGGYSEMVKYYAGVCLIARNATTK